MHDDKGDSDISGVAMKLSDEEQRKFNYYFFEGNRFKAINETNKSFMYFAEALKIDTTCAACAYELSRFLLANENIDEAEQQNTLSVKQWQNRKHQYREPKQYLKPQ